MGVLIDYDSIAIGILRMIEDTGDDESLTAMSLGMLPAKWFNMAVKNLFDGVIAKHTAKWDEPLTDGSLLDDKYKRGLEHELSLAFYRNAKMVV